MNADETYAKWVSWLEEIFNEVSTLAINRHMFWEIQKMVDDNPDLQKPSLFKNVFANMYVDSTVIGLRRQLKADSDSVSLKRLLAQVSSMPKVLSRERYVGLYKGTKYLKEMAHGYFDEYAHKGGEHVDPDLVTADITRLKELTTLLEDYADKRIAHADKRPLKKIPKLVELNEALDFLETLVKKYFLMVKATSTDFDHCLEDDWKGIFTIPWLKET